MSTCWAPAIADVSSSVSVSLSGRSAPPTISSVGVCTSASLVYAGGVSGISSCTGYLGYPFEKSVAGRVASGISIEDAMVFGGGEAARRTLSLSGTSS